jgi:uncharacterized protein YfiM (DUF2279 family)
MDPIPANKQKANLRNMSERINVNIGYKLRNWTGPCQSAGAYTVGSQVVHLNEKGNPYQMVAVVRWSRNLVTLSIMATFLTSMVVRAQESGSDTMTYAPDTRCLRNTGIVVGTSLAGTLIILDQAWYADYERSPMHTFDDSGEWLQMDKAGHFFSAYTLGSWGHALMQRCGARPVAARWVGGSLGLFFLTGVELLDGTSAGWGFSWSDMAANAIGTGLFIGQDALWGEQRIVAKFSVHLTPYAEQSPDLLGSGTMERFLKDYNGQTIWLSTNLDRFMPRTGLPKWLSVSVGYGAEGMVSAFPPEEGGGARFRQFYLAPDIDLARIKVRSRAWRTALFVLGSIKFPLPALEFTSTGQVNAHWVVF